MAVAINASAQTPTDELRALLALSEDRLVKLTGRESAQELYAGLDRLVELWPVVQALGVDVRGEQSRWETLQAQLRQRGPQVVAAWGGRRALAAARAKACPDESRWWWQLDEIAATQRRDRILKVAGIVAALVAVVALVVFLFDRLMPVDEAVQASYRLRTDAETAMLAGDYATARDSMQQAVQALPENPDQWITLGVLAERLGDAEGAARSWDEARGLLSGKEAEFLAQRGMAYGQIGQFDRAIQDELAALALDPALARAYLYLGAAYEGQNKIPEAIDAYTQASSLAGDADPQLTVLARARLASLLQQAR